MKTLPDEISDLGKRKINTERTKCVQELGDGFLREKRRGSFTFFLGTLLLIGEEKNV
jgi:hypothetical protein